MKKLILLIPTLICLKIADAQILTIDKADTSEYEKKTVCQGSLSTGLEGDKQKKLLLDATNSLDFQLQRYKELLILAASYRFTYNGGEDFLNSGYIHLRWRHLYKNTWQPETFVQYQWDDSRGLLFRFISGVNLRYNFWHKKNWQLSMASGLMYENEIWNYTAVDSALKPAFAKNKITRLLKSNNYVRWEGKTSANSNMSVMLYYQMPFNNLFKQYRLASNFRFDVSFTKHFDFGIAFSSMYDSKPVVPIFKFYYNFSNSIAYRF